MTLQGKGFFTFILPECEGGDPASIQAAAQAAGLSHVLVKIADGERPYGFDASEIDITAPGCPGFARGRDCRLGLALRPRR